MKFFQFESYRKGILWSTIFSALSKGLAFMNAFVVAYFFSVNEGTDIYFYLFASVIIAGAFSNSINNTVIIPESMRIRAEEDIIEVQRFLNFFIYLYCIISLIALLIISPKVVSFFAIVSRFDVQQLNSHKELLYLSLPLFGLVGVVNLLSDILASQRVFTITMVIATINALSSILFVLLFHLKLGISAAFYGLLFSYGINLIILIVLFNNTLEWKWLSVNTSISPRIWKNLGYSHLGTIGSSLSAYAPVYLLSSFDAGVITALSFAQQIAIIPNNLITVQFSTIVGLKMAELFSSKRLNQINSVFLKCADFLHFLMIPISCFLFFYAGQITTILLSFTSLNHQVGEVVALLIRFLGLLLPFYVTNTLISRLFMASLKVKQAFWYQLLFNIIMILSIWKAINSYGIIGYPLVMIGIYILSTLMYYFLERSFFGLLDYVKVLKTLFITFLLNGIIAFFVNLIVKSIEIINPYLVVGIAAGITLVLLVSINSLLQFNKEFNDLLKSIMSSFAFIAHKRSS